MDDRQAFLKSIETAPWDDELIRGVYADWLDEHGEHEEADRQRKYVPAERWLREFARKHSDYFEMSHDYGGEYEDVLYGELMDFLKRHVNGEHNIPLEIGSNYDADFNDYSNEMWQHFEVVTGMPSPQNEYRYEKPPFRCDC